MPDIVTSKTFVDGEKGITAAKLNQIASGSVIQPAFYSAKPSSATLDPTDVLLELKGTGAYAQITGTQLASSVAGQLPVADATQNGMLRQVSGNTTDVVDGTNHCVPIASMPGITQMRLRSFNAIGNPNFEVDQRNVGQVVTNPAANTIPIDRWLGGKTPAVSTNWQRMQIGWGGGVGGANGVIIPGTSFAITNSFLRITNQTVVSSPAATDYLAVMQLIEGMRFRELCNDIHSISLLVRCSIAGLKFGISLRDSPGSPAHSLTKLCQHSATPNTWVLIQLPNLPVWSAGGAFSTLPGVAAYTLAFNLMAGSSLVAPANDTWQNGNFTGAIGQDNFCAQPIGTTFDIAFVQHEPGAICTTPIDCPFTQNYDDCLRYFCKSYLYSQLPGGVNANGAAWGRSQGLATLARTSVRFSKPMAKVPTAVTLYSVNSGAANTVYNETAATNVAATAADIGDTGFLRINMPSGYVATQDVLFHWAADSGW
jgi:hypothetical protein